MREIDYRAWNKKENKMYLDVLNRSFEFMDIPAADFSELVTNTDEWDLQQYIGRKDKKGRKVFEGDILGNGCVIRWYDSLSWEGGGNSHPGFYFKTNDEDKGELSRQDGFNDCEVIGNVWENPEFVKKESIADGYHVTNRPKLE